jgi:hypothetical protein
MASRNQPATSPALERHHVVSDHDAGPRSTADHGDDILYGVRCVSAADCWAVGGQVQGESLVDEILHWFGSKWSSANSKISAKAVGV